MSEPIYADKMDITQITPQLYVGSKPNSLDDVAVLKSLGIAQITSLQSDVEFMNVDQEHDWCLELNVDFVHIPLSQVRPPTRAELDKVRREIRPVGKGPIFVHCYHGVDRTGAFLLAYNVIERGWTFGQGVGELLDRGFHLDLYFWWLPFLRKELSL